MSWCTFSSTKKTFANSVPELKTGYQSEPSLNQDKKSRPPHLNQIHMPCLLNQCDIFQEATRLIAAIVGVYLYHFLSDTAVFEPFARRMNRLQYVQKKNVDKLRESLWKNAAVGTFFLLGYYTSSSEKWWMKRDALFLDWPHGTPEGIRWYYRIYFSYWLQSIDFLLNVTNRHYIVKRRDNTEMIIHHLTTMALMISSYVFDFTRIGLCALMIHDVCDLLLETAKMLVYLSYVNAANVVFAVFAIAWYVLRLVVYPYFIMSPAYTNMYDAVMHSSSSLEESKRYWIWFGNVALLAVVLVLNIYWASLITRMVLAGLGSKRLNKDIRSDSEEESVEMQEKITSGSGDQSAERIAKLRDAEVTASTYKRRLEKNTRIDEQCTKVN